MAIKIFFACFFVSSALSAQIITGSLVGRVVDPSQLGVSQASVVLTHEATGRTRSGVSEATGDFAFNGLEAGRYRLTATMTGFKKMDRRDIILDTGQRLVLGDLGFELGTVSDTVTVAGEVGSVVALQSAERADIVTSRQVDGLMNLGRNAASLVKLLPGVVITTDSNSLNRRVDFQVNGSRRTMNNISIDGLPATDVGNAFALKLNVGQDAVSEVKVLLSNYQAEYGRMAGSNVHIITKSGAREFHGLVSYFKRHEQFNANGFFDNRDGRSRPRYRYNTWSYNVGGPVYIPGKWNRDRNKLFFFWSQEFWPTKEGSIGRVTTPTTQERAGDFSQSNDLNNRLIVIRDPSNGQPFAGNIIPANRLDPNGTALLRFLPAPNFFDRATSLGSYNYIFTSEAESPRRSDTLKVDYSASQKDQIVFSYNTFVEINKGAQTGINWPQWDWHRRNYSRGVSGRYTRLISPSLVNEFHTGWLYHPERDTFLEETTTRNQRKTVGFNAGQLYPENNPFGLIPNATFGGVTGAANLGKEGRFPFDAITNIVNFDEKLTWNHGRHTLKAGAYVEWFQRDIGEPVQFAGLFDFSRNANNPLETNYAYSNAALGVFNSYTEASKKPYAESRSMLVESFVQDNWRIVPRLTLDYGVRLYYVPQIADINDKLAGFVPSQYDPAKKVALIQPGLSGTVRVGVHPVTGATYPAGLIGALAPGVGDPANGMVVAGKNGIPRGLSSNPAIQFAPRVGFAYDVFGNGSTALRGGFGMFYSRPNFGTWVRPFSAQPPLNQTPVVNYGTISTLLSSSGLLFPINVLGLDSNAKVPQVMNFSLSVQRKIGAGTVLDVGYVGSLAHHLVWQRPLNAIPFGANFDPRNLDRQTNLPLAPQFLRPTIGFNNIDMVETAGSSNYHSLQVTAQRRFQKGLQFGLTWTWSKAMDYADEDTTVISSLVSRKVWNYGLASFDRTHNVKFNWLWDAPNLPLNNPVMKLALHGWQVSGIASFVSGSPLGVGFATTVPVDITGSPTDGARIVVTGNPVLPKSERTFERNFRTDVFRVPARGTIGNAARSVIRGPGGNNWDVAIFKSFPLHERVRLQFRAEMYNTFNHTQFTGLDTTARFDPAGNQVNARLGQFISAGDPRIVQFALRLYF